MDTTTGNLTDRIATLSPAKRALLELKLKQHRIGRPQDNTIPRRATQDAPPLSFAQQRLWFLDQFEPNSATYNIPWAVRLQGSLDTAALHHAVNALVARHETLRTTFSVDDDDPKQVIAEKLTLPLPVIDLQSWPESHREAEAERLATVEAQRPFDLARGPLVRVQLLQLGAADSLLLFTMHHIISDGWSMGVCFRELGVLYAAFSTGTAPTLPPLPLQYADFAVWQRQWLQGETLKQQLSYWTQRLAGAPPLLALPTDRPRPAKQTYRGARCSFTLTPAFTTALKRVSQQEGATLFMILLAAFQVLLARYTGQGDIVVGSPIANRQRTEIEGLIGFFVNTLVLRTDVSGNPTFRELLHRVRVGCLEAYSHQDIPFEQLVEELHAPRDLSYTPLVQTFFALQNVPSRVLEFSGLITSRVRVENPTAKFDLSLYMWEGETGDLTGEVEYNTDLFDEGTIVRLTEHYRMLLEGSVANPDGHIATLPLLTSAERQQLLVEWNNTRRDYSSEQCVHHLFAAQVERTPDAVAVVYEGQQLTYRELNARANQLAHFLQRLGVGPEVLVGLCVERSLDMMVGLLGILKAGGAYVPLDPTYPAERLQFMLQDAHPPVLLTQRTLSDRLPPHEARVVYLNADWVQIAHEPQSNPESGVTADTLAYVLYTSGSTGQPKGVLGLHRGLFNRFAWMWETYPFIADEVCCQKTALNFVDSLWELLGPLLQGVRLVILPERSVKDPVLLVQALAQHQITRLVLVPSLLQIVLDTHPDLQIRLPHLRLWITSGEELTAELARQFHTQLPQRTLLNLYGSSEVSADVTWSEIQLVSPEGSVPIGRPIANTQVYLLDAYLQLVPIGVPGDLYIGGEGLARGYLHRPELTAEKFITHSFTGEPARRLYKMGDLARYRPDGVIEFLGRVDHQVKLRGFRIELGEIEAVLRQHPAVQDIVVILREDTPNDKRLIAYIVPRQEQQSTERELRRFLQEKLPDYMVPSAFVILKTLPLTPNGKVDRSALPVPTLALTKERQFVAPQGPLAIQITKIWEQALGIQPISITDNFFELGGNSLLAARVVTQISKVLGKELPLATFFQAPTIEQLTALFRQQGWSASHSLLVPFQRRGSKPPFFCVLGGVALARYMAPDQPFYLFRAYGYGGVRSPSTAEEMASGYLKEVRSLQPQGPYYLGGHSIGGLVAFEMAQQLRRQGQEVALLALLDPAGMGNFQRRVPLGDLFMDESFTPLHGVPARFFLTARWEKLRKLSVQQRARWLWQGTLEHISRKLQFFLCQAYLSADRPIPLSLQPAYVTTLHRRAILHYQAQSYPGPAFLVVTKERPTHFLSTWAQLVPQGLEVHEASGTHMGMFDEEHLPSWVPHFFAALRRTQSSVEITL
jgi:amino acid adenylation domain-containing protein